jgi:hypothetical protein
VLREGTFLGETIKALKELPEAFASTISVPRVAAVLAVGSTLILELQAMVNGYGLRVTSDTPTYLALLRDMALHPFAQVSPFLASSGIQSSHATPDLQALAFIWEAISPHSSLVDPAAAYHLLAIWGLVVTALVSHALFVWVRGFAGSREAWISVPVLLGLFGPADVIWAGDLSVHGFLYGSYFSQTFAVALLLYALHFVPRATTRRRQFAAVLLVALLFLVHPFTGVLYVGLSSIQSAVWAWEGRPEWRRAPWTVALAYLIGVAWPSYSLSQAMAVPLLPGWEVVALGALLPVPVALARAVCSRLGLSLSSRTPETSFELPSVPTALAVAGIATVCIGGIWQEWLATRPITDPLRTTNRLAIYWDNELIRWPLLLGAGFVGVIGLVALWRRGTRLPAFWFCVCFLVGVVGSLGIPIPLWNRLLLFCQLPLAAGTALVLARASLSTKSIVTAGFLASIAIRAFFLYDASPAVTYYPQVWLPSAYNLGSYISPDTRGLVASDPYTSYYIPAATGHKTLVVTKGHVGSNQELAASARGYLLLHDLYVGQDWKRALRGMWRLGVRYVVVDHRITLADRTLEQFSNDVIPLWRTEAQRRQLGNYFARLNTVGTLIADTEQDAIYRLDPKRVRWEVGS